MAPALTQESEPPQTFDNHRRHRRSLSLSPSETESSPPCGNGGLSPPASPLSSYGGMLKEPISCTDLHLAAALTNGTRHHHKCFVNLPTHEGLVRGGLACAGREDSPSPPCPVPLREPLSPEMDSSDSCGDKGDSVADTVNNLLPAPSCEGPPQCVPNMGRLVGFDGSPAYAKSPRVNQSDGATGELLALIGRDFDNVKEIIDTLTKLADHPEVISAMDSAGLRPDTHNTTSMCSLPPHVMPQAVQPPQILVVNEEEEADTHFQDLHSRYSQLERRHTRLLRRLQRVTARGLGVMGSERLREFVAKAGDVLRSECRCLMLPVSGEPTSALTPLEEEEEVTLGSLKAEDMKTLSTTELINLVRRVEAAQGRQLAAATAARVSSGLQSHLAAAIPCLPERVRREAEVFGGELRAAAASHLHHDSDATESSSGGESCDEGDTSGYDPPASARHAPVKHRAFYHYCKTRSWAASRWTWLQAQIADLEYRVLQQQKIYHHIRTNKGSVQVDEPVSKFGTRDPAHVGTRDAALTCLSVPTSPRNTVNGYHGAHARLEEALGQETNSCARTQGILPIKRRRLVRAGASAPIGRKGMVGNVTGSTGCGGRLPPVTCKCVPPLMCVLCARPVVRSVPAPPDPDFQPANERHARLDASFHPALSSISEVCISEQLLELLRNPDLECRPLGGCKENRSSLSGEKKRKKWTRKEAKSEVPKEHSGRARITLKLKKSLITGELMRDSDMRKKRIAAQDALVTLKRLKYEEDDSSSSLYEESLHSSPTVSPAPMDKASYKKEKRFKHSFGGNEYDIDNIVIPFGLVSAARVEFLECKEIDTPKWRAVVPLGPTPVPFDFSFVCSGLPIEEVEFVENECEDVSEEAVLARHARSEELERKKFLQYLHWKVDSGGRNNRTRRTDSSGTNTPDHPLSPRPMEANLETLSPLATPPSTPVAPSEDSNHSVSMVPVAAPSSISGGGSVPPGTFTRRPRAISSSSRLKSTASLDETWGIERDEPKGFVPYEIRQFPLPDAEYEHMVEEALACDITPPSPPPIRASDSPVPPVQGEGVTLETKESGRSSPLSEVTDSAPEDEMGQGESEDPAWTISGVRDDQGTYVLEVVRN